MNWPHGVVTASGRPLLLGDLLGKGGEGAIFHVVGDDRIAVKVYTDGKAHERQPKLEAMIANHLQERTQFVAFPIETVATNRGTFAGFTMRKAIGAKLMHQLCTPGDRKTEFPDADFRFMVRVALNFARAVANIHTLGAVIGDINESGALIDQKGLITVIDSDSFQYQSGGKQFCCRVGKGEYTPPELQGRSLGNVTRTINHDAFGIAVIIFEILFMGRHPFSGIYHGKGDPLTISKAIEECRFAYSPHRSQTKMGPPPHAPVLADVPVNVAEAFQRAFGIPTPGRRERPTAAEWARLLQSMESGIVECRVNPAHCYSRNAQGCPWCRYESGTGSVLFVAHQRVIHGTFDLGQIVAKVERMQSPGPAPDLAGLMPAIAPLVPGKAAKDLKWLVLARKAGGLAIGAVAILLTVNQMGWGLFFLIPAALLFFGKVSGADPILQRRFQAQKGWLESVESWNREAGPQRFEKRKIDLLRTTSSYRALPAVERDRLQELENNKRDLQLQRHLEAYKLSRAKIGGIGDGRKMTLRSFGIETAWDIRPDRITAVPGFGPNLAQRLVDWRRSVESHFRFDPSKPTDLGEIARVRSEIATQKRIMETELIGGVRDLETIRAETFARRHDPNRHQASYFAWRQAETDAAFIAALGRSR